MAESSDKEHGKEWEDAHGQHQSRLGEEDSMFVHSPNYLSIKGAWTYLPSPSLHTELPIVL